MAVVATVQVLVGNPDDCAHPSANAPMVMKIVIKILTSFAMARPPDGAPPGQRQRCAAHSLLGAVHLMSKR